jgi:hypothetical protein
VKGPTRRVTATIAAVLLVATACTNSRVPTAAEAVGLVGAWRSQVQFGDGAFAVVKDLEFMYVFNAGGTMTESSNYDGAPPVPPAYGTWKATGSHTFEARYEFFMTKAPETFENIVQGGGWLPAGHGVLTEDIALADDGNSFTSTIALVLFDQNGQPVEGGGKGNGKGTRIVF